MKGVVMKCNEIYELMPDLAAGLNAATPEVNDHLKSCAACAGKLEEIRQTMALMDAWQTIFVLKSTWGAGGTIAPGLR